MKVAMTLLVRDEADVIDAHIRYHLAQGVDVFIATDNRSDDGTTEVLREHERHGYLHYIYEGDDDYAQQKWVTRMARLAARKYAADWVINSDADEFWWPIEANLGSCLRTVPEGVGVVPVPRVNFVPRPVEDVPVFEQMVVREVRSVNALGKPLQGKMIHRAHPDVVVAQGNHKLRKPALTTMRASSPVIIFHYPLRTYDQFENKIKNGGAAYERNTAVSEKAGQTWRSLYEVWKSGGLPAYYASQVPDGDSIAAGIASGDFVIDRRLLTYLHDADILDAASSQ